ncbi:hypothetical protein [Rodentibacter pneumotropicus]|uniref:Uncharacterized protein n=1 Tax=Rodentibacter pneumotropicus TaxID=758 RepID=A0A4S2QCE1_9PAST|nr:hypothetical protein [Rodentibacter pneumotropicus]NBH76360.1 hypothetical protein [Rodentibacter pneumotropicus]THA04125.1 hypothetical protein D3M73_10490 [Rodentibacter pneumotropicus]THA10727.1 hypothetical protein D3M81_10180 [Rodentibacter pneumotropicus]THA14256.1 hypothetical protein D3M76_08000 [Rodentibacter pneumotropicus]THA14559.1 hypothetical protein D3M82_07500 [Rodentibacter pneumotropicus]
MSQATRTSCLKSARSWHKKYVSYLTKWEQFKRQQNETEANFIYDKMVSALDTAVYLTKKAELLTH